MVEQLTQARDAEGLANLAFDYDRSNNVYRQADGIAPATVRDEIYGRDLLDRLTSLRRGKADDFRLTVPPQSKDGASGLQFSQNWMLDYAGNWRVFSQDDDGDGNEELRQLRLHTPSNDIFLLEPTSAPLHPVAQGLRKGLFALAGLGKAKGPKWHHPQYDAAGNLIQIPQPNKPEDGYRCIYDAWNRLAVVRVPRANGGTRKMVRFRYDGLERMVAKLSYDDNEKISEERIFDYSPGGRLLQERVYDSKFKKQGNLRVDRQYVWGTRGPDDLILRLRDSNGDGKLDERHYALQDALGNVVAITDEKGAVQERFRYLPSGEVEFYDANHKRQDESGAQWNLLLGAQRRDATTGLFIGSDGAYHPLLGRPLQQQLLLGTDEATFLAYYHHGLATADPQSFNSLQYYVPAAGSGVYGRALTDRMKSLSITGGVVALNVVAWANPIGFITGPIVTGATFAIGAYNSYQSRREQLRAAYGGDVTFGDVVPFVVADLTGASGLYSIAYGHDIATGQPISTADRVETAAHLAVGIAVGRATPPVMRATGRMVPNPFRRKQINGKRGASFIPPDDPVLDNSVFSSIVHGDPEALVFAHRNRGLMTIIDSTIDEALLRYNSDDIIAVMSRYNIRSVGDPDPVDVGAMIVRIQSASPGRQPRTVDTASIVVAEANNVRFVTGDRRVVFDALSVGVDTRARFFDPPANTAQRIAFYQRVRQALAASGTDPHSVTGGRQ